MFALVRRNPYAAALSLLFHLVLMSLFFMHREEIRFMDSAAPVESPQPPESVPVIVEESRIAERMEAAKKRQAQQQREILGLKRREDADLQVLRKKAEEERLRLEQLKQEKLEEEKRLAAEREKRLEEEKKAAAEKKKREDEARRLAEEKKKKEEAEKRRLAEEKKKQEAEKKRLAEEKRKKEEAERRKRELAKSIAERDKKVQAAARQSGQSSANQKRDGTGAGGTGRKSGGGGGKEYNKYIGLIRSKVKRNWRRPPGTASDVLVTLKVKLFPGGGVADVRIARSSGYPDYDRSAQDAVYAADPLPVPKGKAFDRFRTLNLKFSPTGIR